MASWFFAGPGSTAHRRRHRGSPGSPGTGPRCSAVPGQLPSGAHARVGDDAGLLDDVARARHAGRPRLRQVDRVGRGHRSGCSPPAAATQSAAGVTTAGGATAMPTGMPVVAGPLPEAELATVSVGFTNPKPPRGDGHVGGHRELQDVAAGRPGRLRDEHVGGAGPARRGAHLEEPAGRAGDAGEGGPRGIGPQRALRSVLAGSVAAGIEARCWPRTGSGCRPPARCPGPWAARSSCSVPLRQLALAQRRRRGGDGRARVGQARGDARRGGSQIP